MLNIGERIKKARKTKYITQEDLASAIGISDKSISAYESNRISPPLHILQKIADTTDQRLSYFLEETLESAILAKLTEVEKQFQEIKKLLEKKNQ